jgi:hypothetical protein
MHSVSSNANAALLLIFSSAALAKIKAPNAAAILERNVRLDFGFVVVAASFLLVCVYSPPSLLLLLMLMLFSLSSVIAFFAEAIVKQWCLPRLKVQNDFDDDDDDDDDDDEDDDATFFEVNAAAL